MSSNLSRVPGGVTTGVSLYRTSALTTINNTETAILFDAEGWDTTNLHSLVSNTSRITIAVAGRYRVTAQLSWAIPAANTNPVSAYIRVNGANSLIRQWAGFPASIIIRQQLEIVLTLAVNDYVELIGHQNTVASLDVNGGVSETFLQVMRES